MPESLTEAIPSSDDPTASTGPVASRGSTVVALQPEAEGRIALAAALRLAAAQNLHEGICNHFSLRVETADGASSAVLINPWGLHWSEVRASDLALVDDHGVQIAGPHPIEPTALFIHLAVHRARHDRHCVMHTHMPYATALALLQDPRLRWASQNALMFKNQVAYYTEYSGLALDPLEGGRIAAALGDKRVLFMANHGVLVCGPDVPTAFNDLYYLERACMAQVLALSTGGKLRRVAKPVADRTARQHESARAEVHLHFIALERVLRRQGSDHAT